MHLSPLPWSLKSLSGWPLLAETSKVRVVGENKVEHLVVLSLKRNPEQFGKTLEIFKQTGD